MSITTRIKQNLWTLIGGFIVVLAACVILWFIHKAVQNRRDLDEKIEKATAEIEQLRNAKIFPSEENIKGLQEDLENIQQIYGEMRDGVSSGKIEIESMNRDVTFIGFLRSHQQSLRDAAGAAGVALPDPRFSFGFSRYDSAFPCRTPELKGEQCAKLLNGLAKQALAIEKVCQMLFDAKVQRLSEVRRVDIEGGQSSEDALAAAITKDPKGLYTTTPFEFRFSCETAALQEFLNAVARSDLFLAVRSLKVETETYTKPIEGSSEIEAGTPQSPAQPPVPSPLGFPSRGIVPPVGIPGNPAAGGRTPLTKTYYRLGVTVRIDLVEFGQKPTTEETGAKKKNGKS